MATSVVVPPDDTEMCGRCGLVVKDGDKALTCDLCRVWVHTKCGGVDRGVPDKLYKIMKELGVDCSTLGIRWFCNRCNPQIDSLKLEVKSIKDRQTTLEKNHESIEGILLRIQEDYSGLKKCVDDLTKTVHQTVNDNQEKVEDNITVLNHEIVELKRSYSDILKENLGEGARGTSTNTASQVRVHEEVSEAWERERRKNQLVIFGIEENSDEGITRNKVKDIMQAVGMDESKVKYFGRVGRSTNDNKTRLVRIVCDDAETKRKFLKEANKLKGIEGYNRIYISNDLTKMQQINDKKLRDKLREIRVNNREAKINNGEIVVFENGSRKILYSQQN